MQFGFSEPQVPTITYEDRDCNNRLGADLLGMVGNKYRRATDQVSVEVVAIDWLPESSEWGIRVVELKDGKRTDINLVYTHSHFFGYRYEVRNFCNE